jgi:hypothetical protein
LRALFPLRDGPYTTTSSLGAVTTPQFDAVKLACGIACNGRLNRRFEDLRAAPALRLLSQEEPALNREESRLAVLWMLKTWLLLVHPRTEFRRGTPEPSAWSGAPSSVWDWLVSGQEPPPGLSAWAFRHVQNAADQGKPGPPRLELPTVVTRGVRIEFSHVDLTLKLVNFTLIYHPGWPIHHPGEASGDVLRVWPFSEGAEIKQLPRSRHRPITWLKGRSLQFRDGTYDGTLPPLTPGVEAESLVVEKLEATY